MNSHYLDCSGCFLRPQQHVDAFKCAKQPGHSELALALKVLAITNDTQRTSQVEKVRRWAEAAITDRWSITR
jgi:hypothetical protein